MPPAARVGDPTNHGGTVGPPRVNAQAIATVFIGGKPAAVVGSQIVCPVPPHAVISGGNVIMPSAPGLNVVLIGGFPAACFGDKTTCGAQVLGGAVNVLIGGPM
ncbi:PAAR domain-containing protein [Saccharopolyspora dendranthemae]|uniref:Putative Zn-binding protein involved in type VI secretion n=1 Tax=Saccharopolyspora dendranthemae TaxID=1181886 RepID=A0A561U821_9PSEU|nr:PAAR domain-containing protein [Saccharopolyspora dendranthemae]TWF95512.1 putative Zn-binding protein involved in type VI secretion [Saccharopolyspora dendranthemae]